MDDDDDVDRKASLMSIQRDEEFVRDCACLYPTDILTKRRERAIRHRSDRYKVERYLRCDESTRVALR